MMMESEDSRMNDRGFIPGGYLTAVQKASKNSSSLVRSASLMLADDSWRSSNGVKLGNVLSGESLEAEKSWGEPSEAAEPESAQALAQERAREVEVTADLRQGAASTRSMDAAATEASAVKVVTMEIQAEAAAIRRTRVGNCKAAAAKAQAEEYERLSSRSIQCLRNAECVARGHFDTTEQAAVDAEWKVKNANSRAVYFRRSSEDKARRAISLDEELRRRAFAADAPPTLEKG
eukprot:IDg13251t1